MKKTVIYTLTGIVSPALTLLLLPVYLNFLSTTDYVILALTNSFLAVFTIFFNLKTDQAYRTLFYYELENKQKQNQLFQTIFSFQLIASFIWLGLFYVLGDWLFSLIFKNNFSFYPYSWILLATFLVTNLCNLYFIHLQNTGKVKTYSRYFIALTLVTHLVQLSVIFMLKLDFLWFLLSGLIVALLFLGVIYRGNRSLFSFSFSKSIFREALCFSLPFIPFLVLYNLENQLDRFFIERYLSLEELAGYAVLISIISTILTFFNSVDNAVRPELYQDLAEKKTAMRHSIQEKLDFYWLIGLLAFSFLLAFGTHIDWFLQHEKYNGIRTYFPWMTLAFLPVIGIRFWALQLVYEKQIGKINWFYFGKIILMTLLFIGLVPIYKIYGAIVTIALSNLLNIVVFFMLTTVRVLPSRKVLFNTLFFIGLNSVILFVTDTNFISLITLSQFLLFSMLFVSHYWVKIKSIMKS